MEHILGGARSVADLGEELLPQLYEREADYLCRVEFAQTTQDILWRRTRLGLRVGTMGAARLEEWLTLRGSRPSHPEHRPATGTR
jgi:glycerol-3-phosphate dehydrogenase